jgi:hypothetical protein
MKAIIAVAVSAAGLSAMVAVVPGGQMGSVAADNELKAEAVVDANGNRICPTPIEPRSVFGNLGGSRQPTRVRKSFISFVPRLEPSEPIAKTDIFLMAQCS